MPYVNGKMYPYTEAGIKKAVGEAKKTGKAVVTKYKKKKK